MKMLRGKGIQDKMNLSPLQVQNLLKRLGI